MSDIPWEIVVIIVPDFFFFFLKAIYKKYLRQKERELFQSGQFELI